MAQLVFTDFSGQEWQAYNGILTQNDEWILKADPYARHAETRPGLHQNS